MLVNAFVSWPSASLTDSLVRTALQKITDSNSFNFITKEQINKNDTPLLQWCSYDDIDHELAHSRRSTVLSSSYTFRKALIRKHYLSRIVATYLKKHPDSVLKDASPRTFEIELAFADELDDMWADELWELGQELDTGASWWIIKPGMADRGMGIRIFHSKDDLQKIMSSFEDEDSEDEKEDRETTGFTSQLRHFVLQEYFNAPLLMDPSETLKSNQLTHELIGRKFHLRVYCLARGDIQVYLYTRILALFSSMPYIPLPPDSQSEDALEIDLRPHLTNTSLQTEFGETNVRLLEELEGFHIFSGPEAGATFNASDIDSIVGQISAILAEAFRAALENPVHFQALPNAFELYGVDFLVTHVQSEDGKRFQVKLLEFNSEPAIEMTGSRLTWILEDLFESTARNCIEPFFIAGKDKEDKWDVGEVRHRFIKCLDESVRG